MEIGKPKFADVYQISSDLGEGAFSVVKLAINKVGIIDRNLDFENTIASQTVLENWSKSGR